MPMTARRQPSITRCLSIRRPWARLIVHGYKSLENRSWGTEYRGRIAIHATPGRRGDYDNYDSLISGPPYCDDNQGREFAAYMMGQQGPTPYELGRNDAGSLIVGSVEIADVVDMTAAQLFAKSPYHDKIDDMLDATPEGFSTPPRCWYGGSEYAWFLANPVYFANPIAIPGKLNLWKLPLDVAERVEREEQRALEAVDWVE